MSPSQRTTLPPERASSLFSIGSVNSPAPSSTTFDGFFHREINPSLLSLITFGLVGLVLPLLPQLVAAPIFLFMVFFTKEWFRLHGGKLTRREGVYFDERNLLNVFKSCDYKLVVVDDCITPINRDVKQTTNKDPGSILEALLYNQKELDVQKWYVDHYGGEWTRAQKNWKERELRKKDKEQMEKMSTARE